MSGTYFDWTSIKKFEYDQLKKDYDKAVQDERTTFTFRNTPVLVDYIKYVLEMLEPKFKNMK